MSSDPCVPYPVACTGPGSGSHEIEMDVQAGKNRGGPGGFTMSTVTIRFAGDGSVVPQVTGSFGEASPVD